MFAENKNPSEEELREREVIKLRERETEDDKNDIRKDNEMKTSESWDDNRWFFFLHYSCSGGIIFLQRLLTCYNEASPARLLMTSCYNHNNNHNNSSIIGLSAFPLPEPSRPTEGHLRSSNRALTCPAHIQGRTSGEDAANQRGGRTAALSAALIGYWSAAQGMKVTSLLVSPVATSPSQARRQTYARKTGSDPVSTVTAAPPGVRSAPAFWWIQRGFQRRAPGRSVTNGPQKTKREVSSAPPPAGRNLKDHWIKSLEWKRLSAEREGRS